MAIERESLRNVIKQKDVFENSLKECKDELEKARLSNNYLQKEVMQLENQVINLRAELEMLRSEINKVRTLSDESSQHKVNQLKEELQLKEVFLLRERAEKDSVLLELTVSNDHLKEDLQRVLVSSKNAERLNQLNLENVSRLEAETKRLRQIQENLEDERNRLIEALQSQQNKQMYPQLIQGESNYSSIEMLSPGSNRDAGGKNAKESKEIDGLKAALKEVYKDLHYSSNFVF